MDYELWSKVKCTFLYLGLFYTEKVLLNIRTKIIAKLYRSVTCLKVRLVESSVTLHNVNLIGKVFGIQ